MPSGYTEKVLQGANFKQFATTCARAFGALVEMRDESLDAPIPDKIEDTQSQYHAEQLAGAQKKLKHFKKMNFARAFKAAARDYRETKKSLEEGRQHALDNQAKIMPVLTEAQAYVPPTPEHEGFKKFMVEQLTDTLRFDGSTSYYDKELATLRQLTPREYKARQIQSAQGDIEYHTDELHKAQESNAGRNKWLSQLKASLA